MKVRVSFTINIDEQAWMSAYGIPKEDVRKDVQEYAYHLIQQHWAEEFSAR